MAACIPALIAADMRLTPTHPEKFDAVLNETDMVLLDIKHADPGRA